MKELSIKQKAKAYDEAIEKAKKWYDANTNEGYRGIFEDIFPELKESEDEKIRKEFIAHCRNTRCVTEEWAERIAKWIAWLEKQGEQSDVLSVPSEYLIHNVWFLGNLWKEAIKDGNSVENCTTLEYIQKHWKEGEYYLRAKQGEQKPILANSARTCKNEQESGNVEPKFKVGDIIHNKKEEYEINTIKISDIKEDRYISGLCYLPFDKQDEWELVEQKSAWSEEDEDYINDLIEYFSQNERLKNTKEDIVIWLKSIRPQ